MNRKEECDKLEYAITLIEAMSATEKSPLGVVKEALTILEFGGLTSKQLLEYIEASGIESHPKKKS